MRRPRARPTASETVAASLLEALPVAVALVDERGEIVAVNRAMARRAVAGGASFAARYPAYHAALDGRLGARRDLVVSRQADGGVVCERLVLEPLVAGAAITVLDDPPTADAQTTRLASLGFMVAGVCHEVSNPLAAIHSMVQILQSKRGANAEMVEKGLASISSNIGRVLAIARMLTDFSRVPGEPTRPVAFAQAVEEAASLLKHQTGPEAVAVDAEIGDDAVVLARPGQLEQVVFNILLNAAQAMAGGGRVTVVGSRRGARVVLAVRDQGPGIAPEHLGRVFEPFFTTKAERAGTGLGLAISSEIVHELGGELRAQNAPGGGACFTIDLPVAGATS